MVAPFLVLFLGFFIYPVVYSFYLSLYSVRPGGTQQFVGLHNYALALTDKSFWQSMRTVVYFGVLQAVTMLLLGLLLALLIDSSIVKGKAFFRLVYFLPYAVPGVIAAIMWGFLYSPQLDPLLGAFGVFSGGKTLNPLSPHNLIYSIVNIVTWEWAGYNMTLYFAALTAIPLEIYEAAKLDGCSELQLALKIKVPLLRPMLIFTSVLSIIGALQLFNEPYVLSNLTLVPDNYTPNMYMYNIAFSFGNLNYSATLAIVLAVVTFVASIIFLYLTSRAERRDRRVYRRETQQRTAAVTRPRLNVGTVAAEVAGAEKGGM